MVKAFSPSDYTTVNPNYATGLGFYTDKTAISDLLQIPAFSASSSPTHEQLGKIIKRTEDFIDEKVGYSFRPIVYENEYHNFEFSRIPYHPHSYYVDYVGFIQLNRPKVKSVLRLEVWQGNTYKNLAGATATVSFSSTVGAASGVVGINHLTSITLTTPDTDTFVLLAETGIGSSLGDDEFCTGLGAVTAAQELAVLINEKHPHYTAQFTNADSGKAKVSTAGSKNLSDYFYATTNTEDKSQVVISSKLPGGDGGNCSITIADAVGQDSGTGKTDFVTEGDNKRLGDWWSINHEGKIFFRQNFPYLRNHSFRITYISGDGRVPGVIHEATTKLVAAELLRHDDSTVLIADSGAQMDIKTKYDELKKDAMAIIDGKKWTIALITD